MRKGEPQHYIINDQLRHLSIKQIKPLNVSFCHQDPIKMGKGTIGLGGKKYFPFREKLRLLE